MLTSSVLHSRPLSASTVPYFQSQITLDKHLCGGNTRGSSFRKGSETSRKIKYTTTVNKMLRFLCIAYFIGAFWAAKLPDVEGTVQSSLDWFKQVESSPCTKTKLLMRKTSGMKGRNVQ